MWNSEKRLFWVCQGFVTETKFEPNIMQVERKCLLEEKNFFFAINIFVKFYFHSCRGWAWFNIRKSLLRWVWSRKLPKTFDFRWDSFFLRYQWIIQRENCATKAFRKLLTNCIYSLREKFFQQDYSFTMVWHFQRWKKLFSQENIFQGKAWLSITSITTSIFVSINEPK